MPRRRALRLSLLGVAGIVVVVVLVAFVATVVVVRRPFPTQDGSLSLPGLSAPATVVRDDRGVPQVYASTADDLFRVQGYVQAQDRFFQMDFRRHVTAGRLSELVGQNDTALQADKVVRTLGWRRVAQPELEQADPTTRRYLDDYARGVNDYIGNRSPVPARASTTRCSAWRSRSRIEPWTPSTPSPGSRRWRGTCAATTTTSSAGPGSTGASRTSSGWTSSAPPTRVPARPDHARRRRRRGRSDPLGEPVPHPFRRPLGGSFDRRRSPTAGPARAGTRPSEVLSALGSAGAQGGSTLRRPR